MICQKCNKEIDDRSNYCMWCGEKVVLEVEMENLSVEEQVYLRVLNDIVPKYIKSPQTLKYPKFNMDMLKVEHEGWDDQHYLIESHIDSQNSFGALIRTKIKIKLNKNKEFVGVAFKENNSLFYSMYRK